MTLDLGWFTASNCRSKVLFPPCRCHPHRYQCGPHSTASHPPLRVCACRRSSLPWGHSSAHMGWMLQNRYNQENPVSDYKYYSLDLSQIVSTHNFQCMICPDCQGISVCLDCPSECQNIKIMMNKRYPIFQSQKAHVQAKSQVGGVKVEVELQVFFEYVKSSLKTANLWREFMSSLSQATQVHTPGKAPIHSNEVKLDTKQYLIARFSKYECM